MSWHDDGKLRAEVSERNGEIMISASDAVAWLRECGPSGERLADLLAEQWLETAWMYADRES